MTRIFYFSPDFPQPSGGVKTLYRHVHRLRELGFNAAIVHQKHGFRAAWHRFDVPVVWLEDRPQFSAADVLVFPEVMADAVRQREDLHPTSLDNGVALLHPRRPMSGVLERPFIALGRTPRGIPFGGRTLTDLFFLICSTDERWHLVALARLSRMLNTADHVASLRAATDAREAHDLIVAFDAEGEA